MSSADSIRIRGARMHNLRNVDVDIPRDRLVVVTGVSGSGKSALVFDTLFAESQRRFLDSLSTYSRQLPGQLQRPDVDTIDGLPPAIAVDQRTRDAGARSTLSTQTEVHDFLRLLFARAGEAHCPNCDSPVGQQSVEAIVQAVMSLEVRQKVMVLAPLVRGRKGKHRDVFDRIGRQGLVRARVDGEIIDASEPPDLKPQASHTIDAVVDRLIVKDGIEPRLRESIDLAVRESGGTCIISHLVDDAWEDCLYSTKFACPACAISFPDIELRSFSFNSPYGACSHCGGLGVEPTDDEEPDSAEFQQLCPECGGDRLAPFPNAVRFCGLRLADVAAMSVEAARSHCATILDGLSASELDAEQRLVAEQTLPDVVSRLQYLEEVGLGYLTLDRPARTLSAGEFQRARLARCLGSGLTGACYILDEPTAGLHARDSTRLVNAVRTLRDQGNSLVVVEHDPIVLAAAEHIIDIGPGAGTDGGRIVATGGHAEVSAVGESATGRYLRHEIQTVPPQQGLFDRDVDGESAIEIRGAGLNNLQGVTARFPHNALSVVTGVSGSGKSSLVVDTLAPIARALANESDPPTGLCDSWSGLADFQRVLECDARPIGRSGRASPATYTGVWTEIRKLFAKTRESRIRGFTARRFSFNVKEGTCAECSGRGMRRVQMKFLPDLLMPCGVCRGARFNRQTLSVRFNGKSVAEVLDMRMDEAAEHFRNFDRIHRVLQTFCDIGLGYLALGQPAHTLSGGEAQRVKLAGSLGQTTRGRSLYLLDEPTAGLHPVDVERLIGTLRRLVEAGHTVVAVEHNLEFIRAADWVIDIGPEAGSGGGQIVAAGTPQAVQSAPGSHTGQALRGLSGPG